MWNENGRRGLVLGGYYFKDTGKVARTAKCPACGMEIVVMEHVLEGIDLDDERIEKTNRGR